MGNGHNRLLLYTHEGKAWVRAAGTWDPMPWHIDRAYRVAGQRGPARVLGPGRRRAAEHAAPARAGGSPRERRRGRRRQPGRTGSPPRSGSPRPAAPVLVLEAADRARRRGAHRGARRCPASTTTRSPRSTRRPRPRRCSRGCRSREHGLRVGPPGRLLAHPLPDGRAAVLVPRPRRDGRARSTRCAPATASAGRAFAAPFLEHFDAVRATMLSGFPPVGGPLRAARRRRARCGARLRAAAARVGRRPRPAAVRGRRRARLALRRRDARRHAARRRRRRRSPPFYLNLLGHAVGWPSPRGGAGRADRRARRPTCASLGGEVRTGARVERVAVRRRARRPASASPAASTSARRS